MYKNINNFVPFQHENVEFKNNIIAFARGQDQTEAQGAFAAVLIYANLVDYVSRQLLKDLLQMLSIQAFQAFGGVMFLDGSKKKTNIPLGSICSELDMFEFPNKGDFLQQLKDFNKLRNDVMHNLMQLDPSDTSQKIDKDIANIKELAEDILNKYNTIANGLTTIWNGVSGAATTTESGGAEAKI